MTEHASPLPPEACLVMSRVLRTGLLLSMALLLAAIGAYVLHHPGESSSQLVASNPIEQYLTPSGLAAGLLGLHPEAFMTLAVIVLAVTPAALILTGFVCFVRARDRPLAEITIVVFVLLILGFLVIGPVLR